MKGFSTKILPTFRPDKAVEIGKETFIPYIEMIGVKSYDELVKWIKERIAYFNSFGCRLSDHALEYVPFGVGDAKAAFDKRMAGGELSKEEVDVISPVRRRSFALTSTFRLTQTCRSLTTHVSVQQSQLSRR